MMTPPPILVVEDCPEDFETISEAAAATGLRHPLVHAKDAQEFIRLQTEFIQAQMKELAEQAKQLGDAATKMTIKPSSNS